jgi:inorganic pyrophosphatase
VLGPRLPAGTRVAVHALGAVGLHDRGFFDDKLICTSTPLDAAAEQRARHAVPRFFRVYGWAKGLLNLWRGRPGRTGLAGWVSAEDAWRRSVPRADWSGPPVPF